MSPEVDAWPICVYLPAHISLAHTSIHLQVFGSTFKICSAPSYFPPPPRLLYSHHLHLNVTTVQSWESLCGSQQPRITLCHPSNHSARHVTHGAKVRAFPENPGASLRPSLWPSPHTFWAALLLCMSSNMVRFALSLACTKKRCFLTRSIACLTLTPAFAQMPATLSLFLTSCLICQPHFYLLWFIFSLTYFTFYLCTLSSSKTLSSLRVNWVCCCCLLHTPIPWNSTWNRMSQSVLEWLHEIIDLFIFLWVKTEAGFRVTELNTAVLFFRVLLSREEAHVKWRYL